MSRDEWGRPPTPDPLPPSREGVCGDFTLPVWDEWSTPSRSRTDRTRKQGKDRTSPGVPGKAI